MLGVELLFVSYKTALSTCAVQRHQNCQTEWKMEHSSESPALVLKRHRMNVAGLEPGAGGCVDIVELKAYSRSISARQTVDGILSLRLSVGSA
jgi:hypothetical protein